MNNLKLSLAILLIAVAMNKNVYGIDSLKLVRTIPLIATTLTTDKTGNVYVGTVDNSIYKFSSKGDSIGFYNSVRIGEISQIDATNPLQILVYYANQNVITILDRVMTEKNKLDLKKIKVYNCPSISNSADGDIWIYDAFNMELKKVNEKLEVKTNSFNFLQQFPSGINPVFICEQDRLLFMVDSSKGILKMDAFGNYITTYHFKTHEMQYSNNQLIFLENKKLIVYNTQNISQVEFNLPMEAEILQARVERNIAYIRYKDRIEIYTLQL
jgi:hypothetical protein